MKLTIKQKTEPRPRQNMVGDGKQKPVHSPCCNLEQEGKRHTFFRPRNKEEKLLYDLIRIDCQLVYSKVSPSVKAENLQTTIAKTLSQYSVRYQPWIGYLCAHCCHHYESQIEKTNLIRQFVQRFRLVFEEGACANVILRQTFRRLKQYCGDSALNPSDSALLSICSKYQQTLLLEFLPVKYSRYIIEQYLSNDDDIDQYVKLCTSLAHFVLDFANPIKQSHFVDLMHRPYMGTVEWPVIIANRFQFSSDPVGIPLVERL